MTVMLLVKSTMRSSLDEWFGMELAGLVWLGGYGGE
jgi:hypothetical protein